MVVAFDGRGDSVGLEGLIDRVRQSKTISDDMYDIALEEEGTVVCYKDVARVDSPLVRDRAEISSGTASTKLYRAILNLNLIFYQEKAHARMKRVALVPEEHASTIHSRFSLSSSDLEEVRFVRLEQEFLERYVSNHGVELPRKLPRLLSRTSHSVFGEMCLQDELDTVLGIKSIYDIQRGSSEFVHVVRDVAKVDTSLLKERLSVRFAPSSYKRILSKARKKGFACYASYSQCSQSSMGKRKRTTVLVPERSEKLLHQNLELEDKDYSDFEVIHRSDVIRYAESHGISGPNLDDLVSTIFPGLGEVYFREDIDRELGLVEEDKPEYVIEEVDGYPVLRDVALIDLNNLAEYSGISTVNALLWINKNKEGLVSFSRWITGENRTIGLHRGTRRNTTIVPRSRAGKIIPWFTIPEAAYSDHVLVEAENSVIEAYKREHGVVGVNEIDLDPITINGENYFIKHDLDFKLGIRKETVPYEMNKVDGKCLISGVTVIDINQLCSYIQRETGKKPNYNSLNATMRRAIKRGFMYFRSPGLKLNLIVPKGHEEDVHKHFKPRPFDYVTVGVTDRHDEPLLELHHPELEGLRYAGVVDSPSLTQDSSFDLQALEGKVQETFARCSSVETLRYSSTRQEQYDLGHIIAADTTFPMLIAGGLQHVAERYLNELYFNVKEGKCIWPLADNVVDKDANQLAEEQRRIEQFTELCETYIADPSEENLFEIFNKIPRLRRAYVAVVGESLNNPSEFRQLRNELDRRITNYKSPKENTRALQAQGRPVLFDRRFGDVFGKEKVELLKSRYQRVQELSKTAKSIFIDKLFNYISAKARNYTFPVMPYNEAVQACRIGVWNALGNYDPLFGFIFISYADKVVKTRALRTLESNIGIPLGSQGLKVYCALRDVANDYRKTYGGKIPYAKLCLEVARTTRKDVAYVDYIGKKGQVRKNTIPLDSHSYEDGNGLNHEKVGENGPLDQDLACIIYDAEYYFEGLTGVLTPTELKVFGKKLGFNGYAPARTLTEIGRGMGRTRERARQIFAQAVTKVAGHFGYAPEEVPAFRERLGV